jgi:hypothetical protein
VANNPVILVLHTEIILDDGKLPSGVQLKDIAKKHDEQVWGTTVPVLGLKATRKRGIATEVHVHDSNEQRACGECIEYAQNERNRNNV